MRKEKRVNIPKACGFFGGSYGFVASFVSQIVISADIRFCVSKDIIGGFC